MRNKWEYLVLSVSLYLDDTSVSRTAWIIEGAVSSGAIQLADMAGVAALYNRLGEQGWELVLQQASSSKHETGKLYTFIGSSELIFKRPASV